MGLPGSGASACCLGALEHLRDHSPHRQLAPPTPSATEETVPLRERLLNCSLMKEAAELWSSIENRMETALRLMDSFRMAHLMLCEYHV
ncbi:hypothetical protein Y1Q_0010481 [Alligator mississippiensis]|uniref:Uncharacterized protein n=1 Tax=Alligator mississippiensis TaxID=8496 RepID=A0A151NDB7_ALLMI|nr:hypothetical protein Y1Q_0010481 [Alligator mississippiensis]